MKTGPKENPALSSSSGFARKVLARVVLKAIALGFVVMGTATQRVSLPNKGDFATPLDDLAKLSEAPADYEFFSSNGMLQYFWDYYSYPIFLAIVLGTSVAALILDGFVPKMRLVFRVWFSGGVMLAYLAGCMTIFFFMAVPTGLPFVVGAVLGFFLPFERGTWLWVGHRAQGRCPECGYQLTGAQQVCPECGADRHARRS